MLSVLKSVSDVNAEYIVINDGSTDTTGIILSKFSSQIKVFTTENKGEANAVNLGIEKSNGEYSLIVNSDDPLISSELFHDSAQILDLDKKIVAVYPDWQIISDVGEVIAIKVTENFSRELLIGEFNCLPGPGAIFRTQNARIINGRNTIFRFGSDYDFWLRLSLHGDFKRIPKVLAQWRSHLDSTSINSKGLVMANERIKIIEDFVSGSKIDKRLSRKARAHAYYHAALLSYFSKDIPARKWILKALFIQRGWIKNSDLRILLFCLFYPLSIYMLPIVNNTPLVNSLLKRRIPNKP